MNKAKKFIEKFARELAESAEAAAGDPRLVAYLSFAARFHSYSFHNTMLIFSQRPDATRVAGYRKWKEMGRQVKKGEKGIVILAPMTIKTKNDDDEEETVTRFRAVHVFDVSQTEGEELPADPMLTGEACPDELVDRLEAFAAGRNIRIVNESHHGAYGSSSGGRIAVDPSLRGADRFAVLVHEIAHELLHQTEKPDRKTREVQAETVSHIVCSTFDVSTAAPNYLFAQGATGEEIMTQLEPVVNAIRTIIAAIESPVDKAANA